MPVSIINRSSRLAAAARLVFPAILALGLAACVGDRPPSSPQPGVKAKFPVTLSPTVASLVLPRGADVDAITDREAVRIGNFAGDYLSHGHGPLTISLPRGGDATGRIDAIGVVLRARGVAQNSVEWQTQEAAADVAAANAIELTYTRFKVATAPCGHWQKDIASDFDNHSWKNFGCAQQHNLAVMLVDPLDLEQPRRMTPPDSARREAVLRDYRIGQATSTERTEQETGTISEVTE